MWWCVWPVHQGDHGGRVAWFGDPGGDDLFPDTLEDLILRRGSRGGVLGEAASAGSAAEGKEAPEEPRRSTTYYVRVNICDDDGGEDMFGNPIMIAEGRHGTAAYDSVHDANAAAGAALYTWLGENCSEWNPEEVHVGKFEGDDSGIVMFTYNDQTVMRDGGGRIELIAQFWGAKKR